MKRILLVLALILAPTVTMAATLGDQDSQVLNLLGDGHGLPPDHPCVLLNLTPEQKASIKEEAYQSMQKHIQTSADVKKAMLALAHTFVSETSTKEEGAAAQATAGTAIAADLQVFGDLGLKVNYEILQPSQRENALLCMIFMKKHHGGGGHHEEPGNPDEGHENPAPPTDQP